MSAHMTPTLVVRRAGSHRLEGSYAGISTASGYLMHLESRGFSTATVRAYPFDLLNFFRFLLEREATITDLVATDLFDYFDWQSKAKSSAGKKVVRLERRRGAAPATMNRRIAVRGLFEYAVISGVRPDNPVPAAHRATGLRPKARGMLGHIGSRRPPTGGRLVRQERRLPESRRPPRSLPSWRT
jgi:integrase/recombinase XerC